MLDEQCEKLAYDQLLSYVNLLKTTKPLKLTFDQAQGLSAKQLSALVLSKEQSKACGGAETAQVFCLFPFWLKTIYLHRAICLFDVNQCPNDLV